MQRLSDPLEQFNQYRLFVAHHSDFHKIPNFNLLPAELPLHAKLQVSVVSLYEFLNTYIFDLILATFFFFFFCLGLVFIAVSICITAENTKLAKKKTNPVAFSLNLLEKITKTILRTNTNLERQEYYAGLYFAFFFIFIANIFGLIPFSFTLTSSFIITFFLAATHFIAINIISVYKDGWKFFSLFLPSGVPIFIAPFLVLIELISYIAKVFSLSIRLFANMMSGHALLKILIGFSWAMLTHGGILFGVAILPWAIVTVIFFLELLIAFLQAYVFVVLLAIYINDIFSAH